MGSVAKFAALNTKLDAISGKLLKNQDYEALMSKESVVEIATYLKENTHYRGVFEDINVDYLHRGEIADILLKRNIALLESLSHYMDGAYRDFLNTLFMRYEVEDLKLIIRALATHEDLQKLKSSFIHSERHAILDFNRLMSVTSIEEIVNLAKDTPYQEAFRNVSEDDLSVREFHAEMNLDAVYFRSLRRRAEKLDQEDREILEDIIGKNIDLINIQWLYRSRTYYQLMPEEILNYTLSGGKSYSFAKMKAIVYADDPKEAIMASLPTRYENLLNREDIYMERTIYQYLYDLFVKLGRSSQMNISKLTAVTHFLEYEIRDIITITEGIRYDVTPEEMKDFLIRRF